MRFIAAAVIVALLAGPEMSLAAQRQPPATESRQPSSQPADSSTAAAAPAAELPVSIARIRRQLATRPASKTDGLKLEYYIDVYGKYPKIDLFTDIDPMAGDVQYGSPTHQEFLNLVTPQEFKSPPADLMTPAFALMKWLMEKGKKKPDPPK
jgi:hypothetical protein